MTRPQPTDTGGLPWEAALLPGIAWPSGGEDRLLPGVSSWQITGLCCLDPACLIWCCLVLIWGTLACKTDGQRPTALWLVRRARQCPGRVAVGLDGSLVPGSCSCSGQAGCRARKTPGGVLGTPGVDAGLMPAASGRCPWQAGECPAGPCQRIMSACLCAAPYCDHWHDVCAWLQSQAASVWLQNAKLS